MLGIVNHFTGDITEEKRNVLIESARIARGKVQPLLALRCDDFDALIIPGGFGAAKNLSNFATTLGAGEGGPDDFTLEPSVASAIKSFHTSKKIIGSCCIAPVLLAKTISGISVTMGCSSGDKFPHGGATGAIEVLNCKHVETTAPCAQAHVDLDNLIVTSAAYMFDGEPHEVLDSVCSMVDKVVELLG